MKVVGDAAEPHVKLGEEGRLYIRPTCLGVVSHRRMPLSNITRVPLRYQWVIPAKHKDVSGQWHGNGCRAVLMLHSLFLHPLPPPHPSPLTPPFTLFPSSCLLVLQELRVEPDHGLLLGNQTVELKWTFAPRQSARYVMRVPCVIYNASDEQISKGGKCSVHGSTGPDRLTSLDFLSMNQSPSKLPILASLVKAPWLL